jgi:hypothetical protein
MDEEQVDALFARYVEQLVLHGAHLEVDELASGDAELAAALRSRIQAFQKVDAALDRRLEPLTGKTLGRYLVLAATRTPRAVARRRPRCLRTPRRCDGRTP